MPDIFFERRAPLEVTAHLCEDPVEGADLIGQAPRDTIPQCFLHRRGKRAVLLGRHDVVCPVHEPKPDI